MPDAFIDLARVTRSHIPAANTPAKMDVPNVRQTTLLEAQDTNLGDPRTLAARQSSTPTQKRGRPLGSKDSQPRKRKTTAQRPEEPTMNATIAYSFYPTHEEILDYGNVFEETNPLPENREISVYYPPHVKPVGYKWVFVQKHNENNEIVSYKARLVAQDFSQSPGIDYDETYSPVMDMITFRYLITLVVSEKLDMQLMDVIAYLYGDLDTEIYIKVPE